MQNEINVTIKGKLMPHEKDCKYKKALECPVGIECKHGYDCCPICDPCTCKEKNIKEKMKNER